MLTKHPINLLQRSPIVKKPKSWIEEIKIDSNSALKVIYAEHRIGCINWISSKFNVMPEDARDIFQSAVVIMYENVMCNKIKNTSVSLRAYLIGICNNLTYSWLRKEKKYVNSLPMSLLVNYIYEDLNEEDERSIQFELCSKCMERLGSPCKKILTYFYFENKSMAEIKEKLGYKNEQTVKSQKYKCMQRLKKLMIK